MLTIFLASCSASDCLSSVLMPTRQNRPLPISETSSLSTERANQREDHAGQRGMMRPSGSFQHGESISAGSERRRKKKSCKHHEHWQTNIAAERLSSRKAGRSPLRLFFREMISGRSSGPVLVALEPPQEQIRAALVMGNKKESVSCPFQSFPFCFSYLLFCTPSAPARRALSLSAFLSRLWSPAAAPTPTPAAPSLQPQTFVS